MDPSLEKVMPAADPDDMYNLIDIGHRRHLATFDEIRTAYRRAVLLYHPDKGKERDDVKFKKVQFAFETLSDVIRRRAYDSGDSTFDESIPSKKAAERASGSWKDFSELFGPVFEANARWSERQPMPTLGDEDASFKYVKAFYDAWIKFDSWRTFGHLDEFKAEEIENADSRDEKRWMKRQNDTAQKGALKAERQRMMDLATRAQANDPRMIKFTKEQEEARKAAKKAKGRKRFDANKPSAPNSAEAEARAAKQKAEIVRKAKNVEGEALRAALKKAKGSIQKPDEPEFKFVLTHAPLASLKMLTQTVKANGSEEFTRFFAELLKEAKAAQPEEAAALTAKGPTKQTQSQLDAAPWTEEELGLLANTLRKYPAGSTNRWEVVRDHMGSSRSTKAIIAKTKQVAAEVDANRLRQHDDYAKGASDYERMQAQKKDKAAAQEALDIASGKITADTGVIDRSVWLPEEQTRLEEALAKFPHEMGKQRWAPIAAHVGSRSKRECVERVKVCRSAVQTQAE
jgi:DnaJ family protein C protein 2